ncbi:MAG: SipW-dependent-type signal peptide-containing protein [Clostridia bacterium]|nr:SipW-dependent-type signal peptide-containing protein [Clostridia bacterium]MBR7111933.1 SipW-dependent-type signal peptide-containing protein [Clostridia bacterium]
MTKTIGLKHRLLAGVLALVMALTAFIGTTFAWFTDSVTSGSNIIQSGSLQVEMHWSDTLLSADSTEWKNAEGVPIFTYDNWEPNYTEVKYIKISNVGNLALKWRLSIKAESALTKLADVIDVYYINPVTETVTSLEGKTSVGLLTNVINTHKHTGGVLLPAGEQSTAYTVGEVILAVAFHMHKDAGNEYKNLTVGDGFSVDLVATQFDYENDVFGNDYDVNAPFPDMKDVDVVIEVPVENGAVKTTTTVSGEGYTATVLEGTKVTAADGKLGLTVTEKEKSESNVNVGADEVLRPLDVHVEGVAADNTKPIIVNLGKVMAPGMNMGNYTLYHVENGTANAMTLVSAPAELDAHNEFYYNPVTGEVTVAMATFSEVALVADTVNAWEGKFDYTWYDASKTELTIANADQLAAFGAIVGGMAKKDGAGKIYTSTGVDESATVVQDSFNGKTVKLLADINLGDKESENNESFIFHPIGYWNNEEMYERKPVEERQEAVQSGFYAFEGTFDGNGNTIANFYHNTWEIKGDHNWYSAVTEQYFRDGMGLFGKVYGGTVKNLTVDNFSSDGEITTTGVIAAYADSKAGQPAVFENIAITHCNPRVYNIGNGGIVGCAGWYSKDDDLGNADYTNAVVFRNITVDQSNTISALWGTYDVSCGGILGQYYPDSNCGIKLENCHVSAIIDVNNDVCANYQYYWYRYSGMFIGTIRANTKDDAGYTVADPTGIIAENCTYSYGSWNEYWYCELVKNSSASYTHDYQFGRLTNINDISEIKSGDAWIKEGNFALVSDDRKSVECYHIFKDSNGNLYRHFHDVADESNPNIYEDFDLNGDGLLNDLKEDRQRYYLPFGQVFNGLGYGVKPTYTFDGFTLVEDGTVISGEKFNVKGDADLTYRPGEKIYLKDLVELGVDLSKLSQSSLYVAASPIGENDSVSISYSRDVENWENNYFVISGDTKGAFKLVITDYFYCTPTVIVFNAETTAQKFEAKDVSDKNAYTQIILGDLFIGASIDDNVTATVLVDGAEFTTIDATKDDWATKSLILTKDGKYTVTIKENDDYCQATTVEFTVNKIDKFTANNVGTQNAYTQLTLGQLFVAKDASIIGDVIVTLTNANGTFTINATKDDWATKTIDLTKDGSWTVTITDNAACNEASVTFTVDVADKFDVKFDGDFLYRVGNGNSTPISALFGDLSYSIAPSNLKIEIAKVVDGDVSWMTNSTHADWTKWTIDFDGTGVVVITVSADGAKTVTLTLEVVDAWNATTALSAPYQVKNDKGEVIANHNVVLLNDVTGGFTTSAGYGFYGNGFTITLDPASHSLRKGNGYAGYIHMNGGVIDNVRIEGPVFAESYIYQSQGLPAGTTNADSIVNYFRNVICIDSGDAVITNSYISGARTAIYVKSGGNVTIENSRIVGGAYANIEVASADSLTLKDVVTEQKETMDSYGANKQVIGIGIVINDATTKLIVKGLTQYNWMTQTQWDAMLGSYKNVFPKLFTDATYTNLWYTNDETTKIVNTGIIYACDATNPTIEGSILGYGNKQISLNDKNGIVYTMMHNGDSVQLPDSAINAPDYESKTQGAVSPAVKPDYTTKNNEPAQGDSNDFCYYDNTTKKYLISFDEGGTKAWYYDILTITKGKIDLRYIVSVSGNAVINEADKTITFSDAGDYLVTYTYTDDINYKLSEGKVVAYTVTYTEQIHIAVFEVADTSAKTEFKFGNNGFRTETVNGNTYVMPDVNATVDSNTNGIRKTTVGGVDIYYPVVSMHKSGSSKWYNCFSVFEAVTIKDLNGTEYNLDTTELPSGFTVVGGFILNANGAVSSAESNNGTGIFNYSTGKEICCDTTTYPQGGLCYYPKSEFDSGTNSRDEQTIVAKYQYTDSNGKTFYYYVGYWCEKHTKSCVTGDTLVTLADGTQKQIKDITANDTLLVWNFFKGEYAAVPSALIVNHGYDDQTIIKLTFEDGTIVKAITAHSFFDVNTNKWELIDAKNAYNYIGHAFVQATGDGYTTVKLVDVEVYEEYTESYSLVSAYHYNFIAENMFSLTNSVHNMLAGLMVGEDMTYDSTTLANDLAQYGQYTYADFADYISYEQYVAFNGDYLKISVEKGYITFEEILDLIYTYLQ